MQGASPLASPGLDGTRHWLSPAVPALKGACFFSCWLRWALTLPGGGVRRLGLSAAPAFSLLSCPHPPSPLPGGKGETKVFFMQGAAPLASPGLNPRFAVKPTETFCYGQCRQPRRGGTGGDGTIRRKRRRRLRWSSPPGQGEQVPLGFSPRRVPSTPAEPARQGQSPRRHHSGRAIRQPETAPPIPPPSAPPQPSPQGRRQAPPPEANAGKTQAPARQPFRQQRRGKIRSSTG